MPLDLVQRSGPDTRIGQHHGRWGRLSVRTRCPPFDDRPSAV